VDSDTADRPSFACFEQSIVCHGRISIARSDGCLHRRTGPRRLSEGGPTGIRKHSTFTLHTVLFSLCAHSFPIPPHPSFVFTLAATGITLSISIFSSAEYSVWRANRA
jgi:hypothetical protein